MATDPFPLQEYVQNRITMTPEKFGMMGSYCRSTLKAEFVDDQLQARMFDQQLVRFTMNVMSGKTVSEHPEITLTYDVPESWWQHFKEAALVWRDKQNRRWEGTGYQGQPDTPPPWMVLLWPFLVLFPRWLRRHPIEYATETAKTTVDFKQSVLYPQTDHIPPEFGYPVIYETLEMAHPGYGQTITGIPGSVTPGPSRFLDEYEVMAEFMRDPASAQYDSYRPGSMGGSPHAFLDWLKRNGVNTSQLVKRR